MQLLTLGPQTVPASSPTATLNTRVPLLLERIVTDAVLLAPVMLFLARSPNALFSLLMLFVRAYDHVALLKKPLTLAKEREGTELRCVTAICVVFKGSHSNSCVVGARGYSIKAPPANGRVVVSVLRSSAPAPTAVLKLASVLTRAHTNQRLSFPKPLVWLKGALVPVRRVERADTPWIWCLLGVAFFGKPPS